MKWKLHTPEGASDILIEESMLKNRTKRTISDVFATYGYNEVQTPTFEFYDVFSGSGNIYEQETMFKFFDPEGRILVLRPDITTPIARMVATKMSEDDSPIRLCYSGNAFRNETALNGAVHKEFTQAGIELIGVNSALSDAEVIAVTINALISAGLKNFQIDIGQVEFFKGLMEQAGFDDNQIEKMRVLVDRKDSLAIEETLETLDADDGLKQLIVGLCELFGGIDVIDNIDERILDKKAKDALYNIKEVYDILCDYGLSEYISIDLGMVKSIDYYTGIIFKGFAHGIGYPVCGGGRYDNLIGEFGKDIAATGVAIGIDRLVSALVWQNKDLEIPVCDILVYYDADSRKTGYKISSDLRKKGIITETYLKCDGIENAKNYAKNKGIKKIAQVCNDEVNMMDVFSGTEKITTYSDILEEK